MSIRGVWQLLRLNVNYCDHSGSSKHIRAFVNSSLTEYAAQYPHATGSVKVTATTAETVRELLINGKNVSPGQPSDDIPLVSGGGRAQILGTLRYPWAIICRISRVPTR